MRRYLRVCLLSATLLIPVGIKAEDEHHNNINKRYYDRDAHDYHEWNEQEDRAYRRFLEDQHREYHAWTKLKSHEQREYWKWRHAHPDSELFRDHDRDHDRR